MLAVKFNNIGKKYIISYEKEAIVRHILPRFLKIKSYKEFWALKDINLEVNRGQTIGILGRNGAGKTTLLNIIAGITFPSEGNFFVNGKVSALLSLGAGFHPELTGEENIYINGAILGLKIREIKKRLKDIVEFSELGDFINAPLQTYSQGMYMRLGFAIAINVDFDILLIDEMLVVGDIAFQNKCLEKLREFITLRKTIIIAAQSLSLLETLCNEVILLEKGKSIYQGNTKEGIDYYKKIMAGEDIKLKTDLKESAIHINQRMILTNETKQLIPGWGTKSGSGEAEITNVNILDNRGKERNIFKAGEDIAVRSEYVINKPIDNPIFGVAIFREDFVYCYGPNTRFDNIRIERLKEGYGNFSITFKKIPLLSGSYRISVAIWEKNIRFAYDHHYAFYKFKVYSDSNSKGLFITPYYWKINGKRIDESNNEYNIKGMTYEEENSFLLKVKEVSLKQAAPFNNLKITEKEFYTNKNLEIRIIFDTYSIIKNSFFQIAIFRTDGLYCHSAQLSLKNNLNYGENVLTLIYPQINLLPNYYYLIFNAWEGENLSSICFCKNLSKFKTVFSKKDHGVVYLDHKWNLNI